MITWPQKIQRLYLGAACLGMFCSILSIVAVIFSVIQSDVQVKMMWVLLLALLVSPVATLIFSICMPCSDSYKAQLRSQMLAIKSVFSVTLAAIALISLYVPNRNADELHLFQVSLVALLGSCLVFTPLFFISSHLIHLLEDEEKVSLTKQEETDLE